MHTTVRTTNCATLSTLLILMALATPSPAAAIAPGLSSGGDDATLGSTDLLALTGLALAGGSTAFVVVDVVHAIRGRRLPPRWAVVELMVGISSAAVGLPLAMSDTASDDVRPLGNVLLVFASGLVAHGSLTLIVDDGPPEPDVNRTREDPNAPDGDPWWRRTDPQAALQLRLSPSVDSAGTVAGGGLQLHGSF